MNQLDNSFKKDELEKILGHPEIKGLEDYKKIFYHCQKKLVLSQLKIAVHLKHNYPEIYNKHNTGDGNEILKLKTLSCYIPDFVKNMKDPYVEEKVSKIREMWKRMNATGLEIHCLKG